MPETRKNGFCNPFLELMIDLAKSAERQRVSVERYQKQQSVLFNAAKKYLIELHDFLYKQLGRQSLLPDRLSFDRLGDMFPFQDAKYDHIDRIEPRQRWLQHLLLNKSCESGLLDFDSLNRRYFQNKFPDMQRLACEVNMVFAKWEKFVFAELEVIPGEVRAGEEYVSRETRTGNWRRVKRMKFYQTPDRGKLVFKLVSLPDLEPRKRKR